MANVHEFGAVGDGKADDTNAIQHAIDKGDGAVEFPRGDYRLTSSLLVDLEKRGRTSLHGFGGVAKLIMEGEGPAIFLKATHAKSADPLGFRPEEWQRERMPTVAGLEIEGRNPNADGIRIEGVMQPTLTGVLIRQVRTAVHVTSARGVTITGNYIYSGHHRNVLVENSRNVVLGANCFGHNPDYRKNELATGIRFVDSTACNIVGVLIEDAQAGKHTVPGTVPIERQGLIELVRCSRMNISGTQVLDGTPNGMYLEDCTDTLITGCTVLDNRKPKLMKSAIVWKGTGQGSMIAASRVGSGADAVLSVPEDVIQDGERL